MKNALIAALVAAISFVVFSGSAGASTATPYLNLSNVDEYGFTVDVSDSDWTLDSCSGVGTWADGTTQQFLDEGDGQEIWENPPAPSPGPTSIQIQCQVEDDGVQVGTKTKWYTHRRIKPAARVSGKSATCDIGSHYYSTLTINCLNSSSSGWAVWYVPLYKGERLKQVQWSYNRFASTTTGYGSYRIVPGGWVRVIIHVAAGRLLLVNSIHVVVKWGKHRVPVYGNLYRTVNETIPITYP